MIKPMLASDYDESKLKFPLIAQPKIDGVRALHLEDGLTGRSLKRHKNKHATSYFSHQIFHGFDGEMSVVYLGPTHPLLCSKTSSALSTIEGEPDLVWNVFDYLTEATIHLPYEDRLVALAKRVQELMAQAEGNHVLEEMVSRLELVPYVYCHTLEELLELDSRWLDQGFEGTIVRDPKGLYKQGRSTVKEGGLLRIKRFVDAEILVTRIVEGRSNQNEAKKNELGHTERSTHQENMVPSGMVGTIIGTLLADVFDLQGNLVLRKGEEVEVGPGKLTHDERKQYFEDQSLILHKIGKIKLFPKGIKDKPRFPTWVCFRAAEDM